MTSVRVAFAIPSLARGGTGEAQGGPEGVFTSLLATIDTSRFDVHLIVDSRAGSNLLGEIRDEVTVTPLGTDGRTRPIRAAERYPVDRLVRAVRSIRPDVLLSTLRMNVTCALAKPLLPRDTALVCRVANNLTGTLDTQRRSSTGLKNRGVERLHRSVLARADLVIAQSSAMEVDLTSRFGALVGDKIRRLPNPVDVDGLRQRALRPVDPPLPSGTPHLVSVGRLHWQKGYDNLVSAFAEVVRQWPEAHLRILGEGPDRLALEAQIDDLALGGHVELPGFAADPASQLAAADLYVCSSRYEGFSNALAEALAVGTPAVAPDGPAAGGDLLDPDNGVLLPDGSIPSLVDGITRALRTDFDREAISRDCRDRFSREAVVARYEAVIAEAAAAR